MVVKFRKMIYIMLTALMASQVVFAQAYKYNPVVTMSITIDGQAKEMTAPESGTVTATLKDGTQIGFRPRIEDAKPWTRVTVAIFKMATASHADEALGEIEVKTGAPAVQTKTTPVFKIAVTKVSPPAS